MDGARTWSVYDGQGRLAALVTDRPGVFELSQPPLPGTEGPPVRFGGVRCLLLEHESTLLRLTCRARDLDDLFDGLLRSRFRVVDGVPRPDRFARL